MPGIRVCQRCEGGSALRRAATPRAYKGAAGEKTSHKIDTIFKLAAQEDSDGPGRLLSPIRVTAAADRSESTTLLVSEGSGLPQALQPAFDDGARPPPLALLAQVHHPVTDSEPR